MALQARADISPPIINREVNSRSYRLRTRLSAISSGIMTAQVSCGEHAVVSVRSYYK